MKQLIIAAAASLIPTAAGAQVIQDLPTLRTAPMIVQATPAVPPAATVTAPSAAPAKPVKVEKSPPEEFSKRHPIVAKASKAAVAPILFPFKLFGKTKVGKAFYREVSLDEKNLFEQVAKLDDHISPYSNVIGVGASGLSILNSVKLLSLH